MTDGSTDEVSSGLDSSLPPLTVSAQLRVRADHSVTHLRGAALFASDCKPLEAEYQWPATREVLLRHVASASGAVVLSVCALEAFANELQLAAGDGLGSSLDPVVEASPLIHRLWYSVENAPLLPRFQWVLEVCGLPTLDLGALPSQAVSDLIVIRNALVHYRTEWTDDASTSTQLEDRLAGKFVENLLCTQSQLFFPYRCLGHGCGAWAVRTVLDFVREYCDRLSLPYRFQKFEEEIQGYLQV